MSNIILLFLCMLIGVILLNRPGFAGGSNS